NGAKIADLLFEAQATRGTTLVLVTHDTGLADRASRVVRLQSGRIVGDAAGGDNQVPLAAAAG
ncbi:MAG: ABC transporter ATP-binding protein, partial [Hyphomicrobiales bacterium]|nr:ABC transporter ATP-binding protein [Hyphomicrobiales bacterium]